MTNMIQVSSNLATVVLHLRDFAERRDRPHVPFSCQEKTLLYFEKDSLLRQSFEKDCLISLDCLTFRGAP